MIINKYFLTIKHVQKDKKNMKENCGFTFCE